MVCYPMWMATNVFWGLCGLTLLIAAFYLWKDNRR